MKTENKDLFILPVLMASLTLMPGLVTAQTFTVLHTFTALSASTNSDGAKPISGLVLSGNTLYGTAYNGGSPSGGIVFAVNTDGTAFTNLHNFTCGSDGCRPAAGLTLSGNTLYGTTQFGGSGSGTVFAMNTDGTGFTNIYTFTAWSSGSTNSDGARPAGGLVLDRDTLYGTTTSGGNPGIGTIFSVKTNGTGFTNLHNCVASTGGTPSASLLLSNNILYGTAKFGGSFGDGTVFAINTDGTGFTNLHSFSNAGGNPVSELTLSGNTLYGTIQAGGSSDSGAVFTINTDGTGFTNLYSFSASGTDGGLPLAGLLLSANTLYGSSSRGGISPSFPGTVFAINTDGTGFRKLHDFAPTVGGKNSDGSLPSAKLFLSGNTLYGTAASGGASGSGTVFSIFIQPQLTIISSESNVILTWPTNYPSFNLQFATDLVSPVWTTNSTAPVIVNSQSTVTNPISGTQQFFRLIQ